MTTHNTIRIEAYDIATFASKIQEAVLAGYKLNLEDNDKYPIQVGIGIYATMDKDEFISQTEKVELIDATLAIPTPTVTKGRPKK